MTYGEILIVSSLGLLFAALWISLLRSSVRHRG